MRLYLDRGHRTDGGATDEWRQVGVFVDHLQALLVAAGAEVIRTPDELDSFEAQATALDHLEEYPRDSAAYLACHANVGASRGLVFFNPTSTHGTHLAYAIAHRVSADCYRAEPMSVRTKGYERTPGCIAAITASPLPICGVLLELWSVAPTPSDDAIRQVAESVYRALVPRV